MTILHKDVAVVGGGMVGGALALGLAQQGFSVAVLEKSPPADFDPTSQPDVRISAISASSVQLLRDLGVWDTVLAMRAHPGVVWKPGNGKRHTLFLMPAS